MLIPIRLIYDLPVSNVPTVPAEDWETWIANNEATLLDVRTPDEWELGTLAGATLITMGELIDRIDELPKDRPILCVCRSGNRSDRVAAYLNAQGFDAHNMAGGMHALGLQD